MLARRSVTTPSILQLFRPADLPARYRALQSDRSTAAFPLVGNSFTAPGAYQQYGLTPSGLGHLQYVAL
jgi:hypothetical protein